MDIESIRDYCLSLKDVSEGFPFDDDTLVFKVRDKIFVLLSLENKWMNLKCEPSLAIALREEYPDVIPAYHMNKIHWNTIRLNSNIPSTLLIKWIDHSYEQVVKKLPNKRK